jgi:hypothetical protein
LPTKGVKIRTQPEGELIFHRRRDETFSLSDCVFTPPQLTPKTEIFLDTLFTNFLLDSNSL